VEDQRGREADLTSFLVEASLRPQRDAGISLPCAGGKFYGKRLGESIEGLEGGKITGELALSPGLLADDAARAVALSPGCRFAVPAPHLVAREDAHYGDEEEARATLCEQYRLLFREMRDRGAAGHVCIGGEAVPAELEAFAGRRVLFFVEGADRATLGELLEYQRAIVVRGRDIAGLAELMDECEVATVFLLDPGGDDVERILEVCDAERVRLAGYCTAKCPEYWRRLVDASAVRTA
ncbi:MAG: hypothetical protein QXL43_03965, partial [Methanolinea sp.]